MGYKENKARRAANYAAQQKPPEPPKQPPTPEQLEKLVRGLAGDVQNAHAHFQLWQDLHRAFGTLHEIMEQTLTFWHLTMHANLKTARLHLQRVYDKHEEGLNLVQFIELVRPIIREQIAHHKLTPEQLKMLKLNDSDIDHDLWMAGKPNAEGKREDLVTKLKWQRDNLYAHNNRDNILNGRAEQSKNSINDFQHGQLLERSRSMINKYSGFLTQNVFGMMMIGQGDFEHVLNYVRLGIEAYEAKIDAEEK